MILTVGHMFFLHVTCLLRRQACDERARETRGEERGTQRSREEERGGERRRRKASKGLTRGAAASIATPSRVATQGAKAAAGESEQRSRKTDQLIVVCSEAILCLILLNVFA